MSGTDFVYTMGDPQAEETLGLGGRPSGRRSSRVRRIRILQQRGDAGETGATPETPADAHPVPLSSPIPQPTSLPAARGGPAGGLNHESSVWAASDEEGHAAVLAESPERTLPWTEASGDNEGQSWVPVGLGLPGKDFGDDT